MVELEVGNHLVPIFRVPVARKICGEVGCVIRGFASGDGFSDEIARSEAEIIMLLGANITLHVVSKLEQIRRLRCRPVWWSMVHKCARKESPPQHGFPHHD